LAKAKVVADIESPIGVASLIRGALIESQAGEPHPSVSVLEEQEQFFTLSEASALITVSADSPGYLAGEVAEVIILDRSI
jgi:molybdopterin biosynthesis enzyme